MYVKIALLLRSPSDGEPEEAGDELARRFGYRMA
jgi:hypothetical protein